jgi:nitrite reductase/ring-hydroxylating ferredoxin subunit
VLGRLARGDGEQLTKLFTFESDTLHSGTGEIRCWIVAAGAMGATPATIVDYLPAYHSVTGLGFAYWAADSRRVSRWAGRDGDRHRGPGRREETAMHETAATTTNERLSAWPRYDAAALGFRNYWYPVTWSRQIGARPYTVRLLGDPIMLRREQEKIYAFYDQCPHRGIPLSVGRQEFPGTWSCRYHGWTYDLESGVLKAALTDGPDSPICGKVRVRTYPVEERAGLVWVWMGVEAPTVPVEADIPEEFLGPDTVVVGRITDRDGNWRYAAENGFDSSHAKYLHRYE